MQTHIIALMCHEYYIYLLLEELLEEQIISAVGTRTDQVKIIDHQQEVRVCILVKRLQVEHSCRSLGHFCYIILKVWLALLLYILPIYDIYTTLKKSTLNTYSSKFLNECSLSNTVASANLNVLCFSFAIKFLENFCDLFPFSIDTRYLSIFELYINIVSLSKPWGKIHELSFTHFDDLFRGLAHIYFEVFE